MSITQGGKIGRLDGGGNNYGKFEKTPERNRFLFICFKGRTGEWAAFLSCIDGSGTPHGTI
jgi:hypothetical protein